MYIKQTLKKMAIEIKKQINSADEEVSMSVPWPQMYALVYLALSKARDIAHEKRKISEYLKEALSRDLSVLSNLALSQETQQLVAELKLLVEELSNETSM